MNVPALEAGTLALCAAATLVVGVCRGASFSEAEQFDGGATKLTLHESASFDVGRRGQGLSLPGASFAEWTTGQPLSSESGTITLWVSPLWRPDSDTSHTFLTFRWSGPANSYFVLSQGWWEPQGQGKLYVVVSNQDASACMMPWRDNYQLYLKNEWTMLGVTWQGGRNGFVRLYVDGRKVCERKASFGQSRTAASPVFIGSDRGSTDQRGRPADFIVDDLEIGTRVQTDYEMWQAFARAGLGDENKWLRALLQEREAPANEIRLMSDEDTGWARSRAEIRRRVDRIKAAGFNVYMPCVWDGGKAFFRSSIAPTAASIRDVTQPDYDPLRYLIDYAHGLGIQVHPWFDVARRVSDDFPHEYFDGAPENAFNVQSPAFREFIAKLVIDVAERYAVDGINLDYVRSTGVCTDERCVQAYRAKYGRSIQQDWALHSSGERVPSLIEWNRTAMTDIIGRISAGVRRARPGTTITIDSVPTDFSRLHQGVDDAGWIAAELIDAIVYMAYDDPLDLHTIRTVAKQLGENRLVILVRNYELFGDKLVYRSGALAADYVRLVRSLWPASGVGYYQYYHFTDEQGATLGRTVFGKQSVANWPSPRKRPMPPQDVR